MLQGEKKKEHVKHREFPEIIIKSLLIIFHNWVREAHLRKRAQQHSQRGQRVTQQPVHEVYSRR